MRKVLLFIGVLFLSFGLAACDLLPEDVQEQITEELCKEDPNNELCNLDTLEDLEDNAVIALVEDLYEKYKDTDVTDYCEDFISPSNPDLLDKCRSNDFSLFPEDLTEWTPTEVSKDGSMYKVKGEHNLSNMEFHVELTVVDIDGRLYIEDFEAIVSEMDDPNPGVISREEAFDLFNKYFNEFGDESVDNDVFCEKYHGGNGTEYGIDCGGMRDEFFQEYSGVQSAEAQAFEGDIVSGHVTVLKAAGDGENEEFEVKLKLMLQEDGTIIVTEVMDEERDPDMLTEEEAFEFFTNFFKEFGNPTISSDNFCPLYYKDEGIDQDCDGIREEFFEEFEGIEEVEAYRYAGDIVSGHVTVLKLNGGGTEEFELSLQLMRDENGAVYVYQIIENQSDEFDVDEAFDFFTRFFMMFGDPDTPNSVVCPIYKPYRTSDGVDDDCDGIRDEFFEMYEKIESAEARMLNGDIVFGHVTVLKLNGGGTEEFDIELQIARDDSGELYVVDMKDSEHENPLHQEARQAAENMLYDYLDSSFTTDSFFDIHLFANHNTTRSNRTRDMEFFSYGYVLYLEQKDDMSFEALYQLMGNYGHIETRVMHFELREDDDGGFQSYFINIDVATPVLSIEEASDTLDSFLNDVLNPNMDEDEFYMMWMNSGMNTGIFIDAIYTDEWELTRSELEVIDPDLGIFEVEITSTNIRTLEVRVNRIEMAIVVWNDTTVIDMNMRFSWAPDPVYMKAEFRASVEMFYNDYQNPDITNDELNEMYFDWMAPEQILNKRTEDLDNGIVIYLIDISFNLAPDSIEEMKVHAIIDVTYENAAARTHVVPIRVTKRIDKATPLLMILDDDDDDDNIPYDEKMAFLESYLGEINRQSILAKDSCAMLVPAYRIDECVEEKTMMLQMGYHIDGIDYYVNEDGVEYIRIRKRPDLLTQEWDALLDDHLVQFHVGPNGEIKIDLIYDYNFSFEEAYRKGYDHYLAQANNRDLSPDEVCIDFTINSDNYCPMLVDKIRENNVTAVATEFYMDYDMYAYILVVNYEGSDVQLEPDFFILEFEYDPNTMMSVLVFTPYTPQGDTQ